MRTIIVGVIAATGLMVAGCSDKPVTPSSAPATTQASAPATTPASAPVATPDATVVATAAEMPADAKSKCGMCHAIDKKIVGPAWNDVAAKYKGDPGAAGKIATSITKGGDLGWQMGGMPAKGGSGWDDAQIKSIAEFIAGLAK
ncbi:MAG: c-type cytochrome [Gallionellaceae bacterium]|nr:c-type cytochrome [Gallionellaceae bacterium]